MVVLLKKLFNKLNVSFFLSHGTLLGWYRECGFILHTEDLDIFLSNITLLLEFILEFLKVKGTTYRK